MFLFTLQNYKSDTIIQKSEKLVLVESSIYYTYMIYFITWFISYKVKLFNRFKVLQKNQIPCDLK